MGTQAPGQGRALISGAGAQPRPWGHGILCSRTEARAAAPAPPQEAAVLSPCGPREQAEPQVPSAQHRAGGAGTEEAKLPSGHWGRGQRGRGRGGVSHGRTHAALQVLSSRSRGSALHANPHTFETRPSLRAPMHTVCPSPDPPERGPGGQDLHLLWLNSNKMELLVSSLKTRSWGW